MTGLSDVSVLAACSRGSLFSHCNYIAVIAAICRHGNKVKLHKCKHFSSTSVVVGNTYALISFLNKLLVQTEYQLFYKNIYKKSPAGTMFSVALALFSAAALVTAAPDPSVVQVRILNAVF